MVRDNQRVLAEKIETLRRGLSDHYQAKGKDNRKMIALSRELDKLILEYTKQASRNNINNMKESKIDCNKNKGGRCLLKPVLPKIKNLMC